MIYKRSNFFLKCGCSVKIHRTTTEFQRVDRRLMVLIFDSSTFFILKKILENCIHYNKLILSTHFAPPLFSYPLKTSKTFRMFSWGKKKTRSMKWVSLTIIQKYVGYLSSVSQKLTDFG